MQTTRTLHTIGHSTHPLDQFVALLERPGVEALADVRRYPGSRRLPHFARETLAPALAAEGIHYEHLPELGGRRAPRPGSPNGGWRVGQFQGYADHLATAEFAAGVARLEALAAELPTAVMCAEWDFHRCHRRLLSDALVVRGWRVLHIGPRGETTPHALTEFAAVGEDGALTYPPVQTTLGV
jgi:uncharacterized protein (DUF488 family)